MTANVSPESSQEEFKHQKPNKAVDKKILVTQTQAMVEQSLVIESQQPSIEIPEDICLDTETFQEELERMQQIGTKLVKKASKVSSVNSDDFDTNFFNEFVPTTENNIELTKSPSNSAKDVGVEQPDEKHSLQSLRDLIKSGSNTNSEDGDKFAGATKNQSIKAETKKMTLAKYNQDVQMNSDTEAEDDNDLDQVDCDDSEAQELMRICAATKPRGKPSKLARAATLKSQQV